MKFYVSTDWSDGVPRAVGCFTTDEGTRLDRSELEKLGRLFLAAPELLAACCKFEEAMTGNGDLAVALDDALLAIAKAEGRDE